MNAIDETCSNNHPSCSRDVCQERAWVQLPVASRCNVQCNFCNHRFDCLNTNRNGTASAVLAPIHAADCLDQVVARRPETVGAAIAGPGDPFASPAETMETLWLVRWRLPRLALRVASNGLGILPYITELSNLRVRQVILALNAVDPDVGAKIYDWVLDGSRRVRGLEAAALLRARQLEALLQLKEHRIRVEINTIVIPGVNDEHVRDIAEKASAFGADAMNLVPLAPDAGPHSEQLPSSGLTLARLRLQCAQFLPVTIDAPRSYNTNPVGIGEWISTEHPATPDMTRGPILHPSENDSIPVSALFVRPAEPADEHLEKVEQLAF